MTDECLPAFSNCWHAGHLLCHWSSPAENQVPPSSVLAPHSTHGARQLGHILRPKGVYSHLPALPSLRPQPTQCSGTECSAFPIHRPRSRRVPTPPKQEPSCHNQCILRGRQACVVFPHAPDDRPASIRGPVDQTTAHARSCESFRRSSQR